MAAGTRTGPRAQRKATKNMQSQDSFNFGPTRRSGRLGWILSTALVAAAVTSSSASAQTLTTLVNFAGTDGANPYAGLIADANGNLFGTTKNGGAYGYGTVFEIVKTAAGYASTPTILVSFNFSFNDPGGVYPNAGLMADANGNLFGTTVNGGTNGSGGTVFEIPITAGVYANTPTTLVSFNGANGANPYAGVIADANGNLFGTTIGGGAGGYGTVFEIPMTAGGYASTPTTLVSFNGANGVYPYGGLIIDANGNLLGTTAYGGAYQQYGTVFEIPMTAGVYASTPTTLVNFNHSNGGQPYAGFIADANGNLFGTTSYGGPSGYGTVFEIAMTAGVYAGTPTILASFDYNTYGSFPYGALVADANGNLYGTTQNSGPSGGGTVFEIPMTAGVYANTPTTLVSFNGANGANPYAGLIVDANGNLFGTTIGGGAGGVGTVFEITPATNTTPPVITSNVSGTLGNNGWYIGNVTINWTVNGDGITSQSGCGASTVNFDTTGNTFTCEATNAGGATSKSVTIKRDATAPSVSCGAADGLWHASDVSIACAASDSMSGLANPADAGFKLTTSVANGIETAIASTSSRIVTDQAGNSTAAGPITGIKVDKKSPVIALTAPAATSYIFNQAVAANYLCSDGGSGVTSCAGTAANGANINTASAGSRTFTVNAADNVGNTSSASVNYTVNYNFSGFEAPVYNAPAVNTGNAGKTYPVKWQLRDANGNSISALTAVSSVQYQSTSCAAFSNNPTAPLAASTTGSSGLRYDSTANQYIYNWAPGTAGCYTLFLTLDSGQVFPAYFNLN